MTVFRRDLAGVCARGLREASRVLGRAVLLGSICTTAMACHEGGGVPVLRGIDDQVVGVGQELVITLQAADPDGDALHYGFESTSERLMAEGMMTIRPDGTGVFRWTPLAEDVGSWFVDFSASDGDHEDVVTAHIEVRSVVGEGSAPVFRHPLGSGTTLDLERDDCVELDVVVEDADDVEVAIGQEEPTIEGAEVIPVDGLSATWSWCPGKSQLEDDRHPLVLSADDGVNPKTLKNYLVVLRRPARDDCPGEAPVVTHAPADAATLLDVEIRAEVSDDVGLGHEPILYYSTEAPADPIDFSQLDLVQMELVAGDMRAGTWSARIPNPVAGESEGSTAELWYLISAGDNDDPTGTCDHVTEAPGGGMWSMRVTHPGGKGGAGQCEPCSADVQCGATEDLCAIVGSQSETFCLDWCESSADCGEGFGCVTVDSVDGAQAKQCMPVSGSCDDDPAPTCDDDGFEENDTRAQASGKPALPLGDHYDLVACAGDEDWYRVTAGSEGTLGALIEGGAASNLSLGLYGDQGNLLAVSEGPDSSEVVEKCVPAGTYFVRVTSFGAADNGYDMLLDHTPGSCSAVCEDDSAEDDDTVAQAVYAEIWPDPYVSGSRMICSGDDDFYEIELYTGESVAIDLTFAQSSFDEDLDLHFYDEDGTDLTPCSEDDPGTCTAAQGQSATSNERYEYTVAEADCAPCTFYISVHGWSGAQNDYDLAIALQ